MSVCICVCECACVCAHECACECADAGSSVVGHTAEARVLERRGCGVACDSTCGV